MLSKLGIAQGTWTPLADFPQGDGRSGTTSFVVNNTIYYTTGLNDASGPNSQNWAYNTSTNTWSQKAVGQFPPRFYAVSFSLNGKGYLGSGNLAQSKTDTPTSSNDFYEYDPTNDTWNLKNAIGPTGRYGAVSFTIANKGYVAFGANSTVASYPFLWVGSLVPSIYEYDPLTSTWTLKGSSGSFPGTINAQAFVINNKAYVAGGFVPGIVANNATVDGTTIYNTIEFDPITNTWTMKSSLPDGYQRHNGSAFSLLDRGYLTGGHIRAIQNCPSIYSCFAIPGVLKFNPYLNNWTIISGSTPLGNFARASSASNCDYGYITTGARSGSNGSVVYNHLNYKFDEVPDTNYLSGPDLVCSTFDAQFTLQLSNPYYVTWTTSPTLSIVSGQGTKTLKVRSSYSGSAWVQASVNNGCRNLVFPMKVVWSGTYNNSNYPISGTNSSCNNQVVYYSTNTLAGATSYDWFWPSGWTYLSGQGTPYLTLRTGSTSGAIGVRVNNTCGQAGSPAQKYVQINYCSGFSASITPNPTADYINISETKDVTSTDSTYQGPFEVLLFDSNKNTVYQCISDKLELKIPVTDMQNGTYYLNIINKGGVFQKRIQVKK